MVTRYERKIKKYTPLDNLGQILPGDYFPNARHNCADSAGQQTIGVVQRVTSNLVDVAARRGEVHITQKDLPTTLLVRKDDEGDLELLIGGSLAKMLGIKYDEVPYGPAQPDLFPNNA